LDVPIEWLPRVVLPGTPLGAVSAAGAERTGLPRGTPVIAGCTDGTAGCLASGARLPGELNVTLGTTLVFKGIAERPIVDPAGAIYNHRHPAGGYLPGAASSTGAEWVETQFPHADLNQLAQLAEQRVPTSEIVYPLVKQGERFPFASPEARGFGLDQIPDPARRFAAGMQAVAFLERLAIERFETLGLPIGPTVYATGGGTASGLWLKIRATTTRRCYRVPRQAACAMGAAVLAATPALGGCADAIQALIRCEQTVEPHTPWCDALDESYQRFLTALHERGYWRGEL
jgi:sugar (pentulose or hexulose) kinase